MTSFVLCARTPRCVHMLTARCATFHYVLCPRNPLSKLITASNAVQPYVFRHLASLASPVLVIILLASVELIVEFVEVDTAFGFPLDPPVCTVSVASGLLYAVDSCRAQ